jgi:RNA polymerase sigma factor (sigma-70 family)
MNSIPDRANDLLFDLVSSLWLLPLTLLDYYYNELSKNDCLPRISEVLNVYNSLEGLGETKSIAEYALSSRERLINNYLSYVRWFAYKYRNSGLDYEDVIQEGSIGLIKAVDKFDVRRKTRLKTFAVWWIRQSITRAVADNARVIRLPVHLSDNFQRLKSEYRKYNDTHSEEASVQVLAELSELEEKKVIELIHWAKPPIPLEKMKLCEENLARYTGLKYSYQTLWCQDCERITRTQSQQAKALLVDVEIPICLDQSFINPSYEKSDYTNLLYKIFPDSDSEDQIDRIFLERIEQIIDVALDQLNTRERRIIAYRYGFKYREFNTLQEVADKFGVTRERIRQIESAALEKLSKMLEKDPTIRDHNHS